jgi:thiol-disulfide isomerase/thioredoxin
MKIFRASLFLAVCGLLVAATPPEQTAGLRKSPEFVFNTQDGKQLLLSSLHGKVVVIAFMFTTCPHCQAACPVLAGIQKDYAAKGVQFVGDVIDPGAKDGLANFNQSYVRGAFPVGWSPEQAAREYMRIPAGKNFYVPMLSFVDRKGFIHSQYIGDNDFFKDLEPNIRAELDKILGAPAAKPATTKKQ